MEKDHPTPKIQAISVLSDYHDFNDCLKKSHEASDMPFWKECYKKAFLDFDRMIDHREDMPKQSLGIDRTIVLKSGRKITVDEKVRGKNKKTGRIYNDIALEEWSKEEQVKGWVEKSLHCEYIAYAIAPLGICYLLPVLQLQKAWLEHKNDWKCNYPKIIAPNQSYRTISWGVPADIVYKAIHDAMRVKFKPVDM